MTPHTVSVISAGGRIFLLATNLGRGNLRLKESDKVRAFRVGEREKMKCNDDGVERNEFIDAVVSGEANESAPLLLGKNLSAEQKETVLKLLDQYRECLRGVG